MNLNLGYVTRTLPRTHNVVTQISHRKMERQKPKWSRKYVGGGRRGLICALETLSLPVITSTANRNTCLPENDLLLHSHKPENSKFGKRESTEKYTKCRFLQFRSAFGILPQKLDRNKNYYILCSGGCTT